MKRTLYECDRCGKSYSLIPGITSSRIDYSITNKVGEFERKDCLDLCDECTKQFLSLFKDKEIK